MFTGLFSPRGLYTPLHLQAVSPRLEFAQTQLCLKKDNMRHWHSPSLKFARWQRGRKGQK